MKPTHLLLILFLQVLGISQAAAQNPEPWFNTLVVDYSAVHTVPFFAQEHPEGGYVLGVSSISASGSRQANWLRLDEQRQWVGTKQLYGKADYVSNFGGGKNLLTQDGDILLNLSLWTDSTDYDMLLQKVDWDGNIIWETVFDFEEFESINQIINTSDGGYLFVGSYSTLPSNLLMWAVKLKADGSIEWEQVYEELEDWSEALRVVEFDDFYIIGGGGRNENYIWQPWLLKIDKQGNLQQHYIFNENAHCLALVLPHPSLNDRFYVNSCFGNGALDYRALMDTNFNVIWEKTIDYVYHEFTSDALPTQGIGFRYIGTEENESGWDQLYWVERDSSMEVVAVNKIETNPVKNVYPRYFGQTADGGYIIAAYEHFPSPQRGWLIKTDSLGNTCQSACDSLYFILPTSVGLPPIAGTGGLRVYPNPAGDYLNIELTKKNVTLSKRSASKGLMDLSYQIYDLTGRQVLGGQAEQRIKVNHLQTGTYIIQLSDNKANFKTAKFIVNR